MAKTTTTIALPTYLAKFVRGKYGEPYIIKRRVELLPDNRHQFKKSKLLGGGDRISVSMICPDPRRKYAVARDIYESFRGEMYLFVEVWSGTGLCTEKAAIERFLGKYGIGEDDYKYQTAERAWKRYKSGRGKRISCPLSSTGHEGTLPQ